MLCLLSYLKAPRESIRPKTTIIKGMKKKGLKLALNATNSTSMQNRKVKLNQIVIKTLTKLSIHILIVIVAPSFCERRGPFGTCSDA
mgnify:CR=1 FL=1